MQDQIDPENEDLQTLLDRIGRENPSLADALLSVELDDLLGRVAPASAGPKPSSELRRRKGRSKFDWYARLVGSTPLLDPWRIASAAESVEIGLLADERIATLGSRASNIELRELRDLADFGRQEFELLVVSNLRLVFHWSKGVASTIDDDWAQDAFQAGCIGLMRGLQGWDHTKGYALSTFVSWHIRQAVQRWRANEVLLIRLPVHVWEGMDAPTGLTPEVRRAAVRAQNMYSLDAMDVETSDFNWDGGIPDRAKEIENERLVANLLAALPVKEADVLRLRFGLTVEGDEPRTLDAIGESLGVTRERIRQIEKKAIERLRKLTER